MRTACGRWGRTCSQACVLPGILSHPSHSCWTWWSGVGGLGVGRHVAVAWRHVTHSMSHDSTCWASRGTCRTHPGMRLACLATHRRSHVTRSMSCDPMRRASQGTRLTCVWVAGCITEGCQTRPWCWMHRCGAGGLGVTSECTALLSRRSDLGGYRTVASAHALRQPTSCRSKYFYNQRPWVPNLIGSWA